MLALDPVFLQIHKMKPNPGLHLRQTATMSVLFRDVAPLPSIMVSISKKHIIFQDLCKYIVYICIYIPTKGKQALKNEVTY